MAHLAVGRCGGNYRESIAERHITTAAAVHIEGLLRIVVGHHYPLALGIAQCDLGVALEVNNYLASLSGSTYLGTTCGIHLLGRQHAAIGRALVFEESEVAHDGVGRAELLGGNLVGILPVAHPRNGAAATVGSIVEGDSGIVVLAVVHPLGLVWLVLAGELMSVELSDEILCGRTAKGTAGIDVADEHPLLLVSSLHLHLHQVGTLPHTTVIAVFVSERALILPILQISRRINLHLLTSSENHVPESSLIIPEDVRIAEILLFIG